MCIALAKDPSGKITIGKIANQDVVVAYPDETLHAAVTKMLKRDIGRLVVVDRDDPTKLLGYVGRSGILQVWTQLLDEEHTREKSRHLPSMRSFARRSKLLPA